MSNELQQDAPPAPMTVMRGPAIQRTQSIRNDTAQFLGVPPEKVCALLRNVWQTSNGTPDLTDDEMFIGMSMIARYQLDPIAKEVYVTRTKRGLVTIIGIDGFVKILDRTPGYDGFETEFGWSDDGKTLMWVETRIFSKERSHPTVYRAFAEEYNRVAGVVAKQMPWHMLRIFSLRHAVRLFTPIGGEVTTAEEAHWMDQTGQEQPTVSSTLIPIAAPTQAATDGEIPLESEAKEEAPAESTPDLPDLPDQSPILAEYMKDIGKASVDKSVIDAKKILAKATDDKQLSPSSLWEIQRWGEECIGGITSTRGENSNT